MVGDLVKNLRINIKHSRNIITQNKEPAKHKLQIHAILTTIVCYWRRKQNHYWWLHDDIQRCPKLKSGRFKHHKQNHAKKKLTKSEDQLLTVMYPGLHLTSLFSFFITLFGVHNIPVLRTIISTVYPTLIAICNFIHLVCTHSRHLQVSSTYITQLQVTNKWKVHSYGILHCKRMNPMNIEKFIVTLSNENEQKI